jgi:apocytochrome f
MMKLPLNRKKISQFIAYLSVIGMIFVSETAYAFPIYAQQAYANPREANGRIACANCHLAQKTCRN